MHRLTGAVAWVYDFLAEDPVVLLGTLAALVVAVLAVHAARSAAGVILFAAVVLVIAASLWRTVLSRKA
ncbi:MAG TPA: hypothetical protein VKX16_02675 [Chloroflexota bacterium]|nr:hypothetical protein [Chloroflexota bacterium]